MSRANSTRARAQFIRRLTFVMLAGLFAGSCTSGEKGVASRPPAPDKFGDGQATRDYVDDIGFTADTGYVGSYACTPACSQNVRLMFLPREHAQKIKWAEKLDPLKSGDVVAQVVNVDNTTFTDGSFSLAPNEVAYVWVGVIYGGSTPAFGVYRVDSDGHLAGEWSVVPKAKIEFCPHPNPGLRHKPAIHDKHYGPGSCAPIAAAVGSGKTRLASLGISEAYAASAASTSRALAVLGQLWISCSGGCCQVNTN